MANIKSQIKRNRTNEKARLRNKAVKSSLKTAVRKFREAADAGDAAAAAEALARQATRALDKAASKGVIHKNQAANRKSAIASRAAGAGQDRLTHRTTSERAPPRWGGALRRSGPRSVPRGLRTHAHALERSGADAVAHG